MMYKKKRDATPFFIMGTGRCGTRMLMNILNVWPNVRVLPETQFIIPLYNRYKDKDITVRQFLEVVDNIYGERGNKFILRNLDHAGKDYKGYKSEFINYTIDNSLSGNIRDFTVAFFKFLYGGDYYFGDKTPHYGLHLDVVKKYWPKAKIIHIYRDGIDVAESMTKHLGFRKLIPAGIPPEGIPEFWHGIENSNFEAADISISAALSYWERTILGIRQQLQNLERGKDFIEVSYEKILWDPVYHITKIAKFLELEDKYLSKAITIPRPFPEKWQIQKIPKDDYLSYYEEAEEVMEQYGYPFGMPDRGIVGKMSEAYRGRIYYFNKVIDKIKQITPAPLKNRFKSVIKVERWNLS